MDDSTLWVAVGALATLLGVLSYELLRRHQAASEDLQALESVLFEQYRDGLVDQVYAIKIGNEGASSRDLKEIGKALWKPIESHRDYMALRQWDNEWRLKVSTDGLDGPREKWSPETQFAQLLSARLNRLGWFCFYGMVPIQPMLAILGDQIVDDWQAAREFVRQFRNRQGETEFWCKNGASSYVKTHGEWLAILAAIYMQRYCYKLSDLVLNDDEIANSPGGPRRFLRELMSRPGGQAPLGVKLEVWWVLRGTRVDPSRAGRVHTH